MIGSVFFIPLLLPLLAVLGFGWSTATFLFCIPALIPAGFGLSYCSEYKRFDDNAAIYDTIIDMFKSYPDDWTFEKLLSENKKYTLGREYLLHEKISVIVDYRDQTPKPMEITVGDEETKKKLSYQPGRGYRDDIMRAIHDFHNYREMKTMVNITLYADEHRGAADKAIEALNDFRDKKGIKSA